ncbi:phage tail protein [Escherichia coli]|nr:phage tail protein [Escherichia coli]UGA31771.1 phage tail protein [Escherichia coli]
MAGNFADLTAVLTLDSARFSEEAARVKKKSWVKPVRLLI